ncbi:MAG TPA: hypothetical protein VFY78_10675 [Gammaproteobacteria bacterium]|nr:hypothetical protein [Gammaproteobacteria bacterium]
MTMTPRHTLQRLHNILQNRSVDGAQWLERVMALCDQDELACHRELNSKRMWGGAGSIANEALADNPGREAWLWQAETREFRELMIELGEYLKARGNASPDISSWLLAFSNWNQSGV